MAYLWGPEAESLGLNLGFTLQTLLIFLCLDPLICKLEIIKGVSITKKDQEVTRASEVYTTLCDGVLPRILT